VPVWQKLKLQLIKNVNEPNSKTFDVPTGDWGPLWLIHTHKGQREGDGRSWLVRFPAKAEGANGWIRLRVKFERPLPELDNWARQ
jgi:hypothetical protein